VSDSAASPYQPHHHHPKKKLAIMASDASDEDIFDYDYEEASDMDYDDGDSSIDDGTSSSCGRCG
jgi:hypothetical protein